MSLYGNDAIICGYRGEANLSFWLHEGKFRMYSSKTNIYKDRWSSWYFFYEEDTEKILKLLNAKNDSEACEELIKRFRPEYDPDGYDDESVINNFITAILNFFDENGIDWIVENTTYYYDIQERSTSKFVHHSKSK